MITKRYDEIMFFFYCRNIIYQTKTITKLHELIKLLSFTNLYKPDILVDVTIDMFVKKNNIPLLLECVILHDYYPNTMKAYHVRSQFKITQTQLDRAINVIRRNNLTPQTIRPAYPNEVHEAITGFKKTLRKVQVWKGLIND